MYEFNERVRYSETDEHEQATILSVVNYLQDCSTFHSTEVGFTVDYRAGSNVVCHVGNVDTHLHVSVWQSRQRESIVEVLCIARVDGESNCIAHILSLGHLFGGDSGIDFIGSFHHIFRI